MRWPKKYKRGTPIRDRVEPRLRELGYDTSTLRLVRFGGGTVFEIALDDRIMGRYTAQNDELVIFDIPGE
jgi:hypothetical protein